jgi:hypothetical protein
MTDNKEIIKTENAQIWLDEDGICRVNHPDNVHVTLEEARAMIAAIARLRKEDLLPVLIDASPLKSVESEARKFLAGEETTRCTLACAFLVQSTPSRIIGNFFIRFNKPPFPCRLFKSENEALQWLKTFL